MRKQNEQGFSTVELLIISLVVVAVGLGGWYVFNKQADSKNANNQQSTGSTTQAAEKVSDETQAASEATPKPTPQITSAPLREVNLEKYGTSLKLPADWIQQGDGTDTITSFNARDEASNISFSLSISKDYPEALKCFLIAKDSEDLKYDNPLPGQRTVTKLTFSTTDVESGTLCGMMITGAYSAKKGDVFDPYNQTLQDSLPNNRITVYISRFEEVITWPPIEEVTASPKYAELIAALKSIQVK
jgi:Tfp pilus assembly protein PilV